MKVLTVATGRTTSLDRSLLMIFLYMVCLHPYYLFFFFSFSVLIFHAETQNMNNILVATFTQFQLLVSASQDKKITLNSFYPRDMLSLITLRYETTLHRIPQK